jgi:DnaK suppressor protein
MDEARARQLLDDRLHELDESSDDVRAEQDEFRDEISYESGRLSQHPAEYATDVQEVEEHDLALGNANQERGRILAAQQRLHEGTYGICVDCGRRIDDERLEARPQAERCLPCQERAEHRATL